MFRFVFPSLSVNDGNFCIGFAVVFFALLLSIRAQEFAA